MMLDHEHIPASEPDSQWLMVVLHGLGDSMEGYRWLPEALGLPWLNYLLVNAPDSYYDGYSWYDFMDDPAPGVTRSREALFEMLDTQRDNGHPTERTFQFGFSQGCLMTMEIALRYPHKLAGCIGVSGYVHEPEQVLKELSPIAQKQAILFTMGTFDPIIPVDEAKRQVSLLKEDGGLQIESYEFAKDHTIAGEEELSLIRGFLLTQRQSL
jgi:phospholipase/carboxylesterase